MTHKSLLWIIRHAPYGSVLGLEAVEAAMVCAAFDQKVTLLFIDDGVFQLLPAQNPTSTRNMGKAISALPLYDIDDVVVHGPSLRCRGIDPAALVCACRCAEDDDVSRLIASQHAVLSG